MPPVKRERPENTAHFSGLETDNTDNSEDSDWRDEPKLHVVKDSYFLYLNLFLGGNRITALLDSGSSINVLAKGVYDCLSPSLIVDFQPNSDNIVIANGHSVDIWGTASIKICQSPSGKPDIMLVHILGNATHPLILGTDYLKMNNIVLDFSKTTCFNVKPTTKLRCKQSFVIAPNSECVVSGKLSKDLQIGMQGVCIGHAELLHKGLLVAESDVSCSRDRVVPVRILNPGYDSVHVNRGMILGSFKLCDNSVDLIPVSELSCNNIQLQKHGINSEFP